MPEPANNGYDDDCDDDDGIVDGDDGKSFRDSHRQWFIGMTSSCSVTVVFGNPRNVSTACHF